MDARKVLLHAMNVLDARTAPAIDRLVIVAHYHDLSGLACKHAQPSILDRVGVLEFIDQQMAEATLVVLQQSGILKPELMAAKQQFSEVDHAAALAGILISRVDTNHRLREQIAPSFDMPRPPAFVLLAVYEPGRLTWRPALLIQIETFHDALDESLLVLRIQDLEILRQLRFLPVLAKQTVGDAVEGPDPHLANRKVEQRLDPRAHLSRSLVGEGHRKNAVRRRAYRLDQPGDPMHQHTRFARTGACKDEQVFGRRRHRFTLRVVQAFEDMCDVHGAPDVDRDGGVHRLGSLACTAFVRGLRP